METCLTITQLYTSCGQKDLRPVVSGFLSPLFEKLFVTIKAINSSSEKCVRDIVSRSVDPATLGLCRERMAKDVHFQVIYGDTPRAPGFVFIFEQQTQKKA
jgi:hypothetical protein